MLDGFEQRSFQADTQLGHTIVHDVYTKGDSVATIVIIQELPGIGKETLDLADTFFENGYRVVLPHLFGPLGRTTMLRNLVRVFCMRREFHLFEKQGTSPIVDWLRALCRDLKQTHGATGVGVVGMCLTGNFAISLMADEHVLAGVASQPSMPLLSQTHLHMSSTEIEATRQRLDAEGPMIALRFECDRLCTADKFQQLEQAFNDDRERIQLVELPGRGHSVLTRDLISGGKPAQQALQDVLAYFAKKLKPATSVD